MWNKKFLIEYFKLQLIVNILVFIALLQIKLFSIFQIRKLFCLIFFNIYWDDSSKFSKSGRTISVRDFKMIVDGWDGWYFQLDCFVADNFVSGLLEEENTVSCLPFCFVFIVIFSKLTARGQFSFSLSLSLSRL